MRIICNNGKNNFEVEVDFNHSRFFLHLTATHYFFDSYTVVKYATAMLVNARTSISTLPRMISGLLAHNCWSLVTNKYEATQSASGSNLSLISSNPT